MFSDVFCCLKMTCIFLMLCYILFLVMFFFKIHLADGLVQEAEKLLCQLICYTGEKKIRMKFIEGCVANLAANRYTL